MTADAVDPESVYEIGSDRFPPLVVEPERARATREQWGWLLNR